MKLTRLFKSIAVFLLILAAPLVFAGDRWQKPIVIGWTPPDITGVFKTATNFFEAAAKDGNNHGDNEEWGSDVHRAGSLLSSAYQKGAPFKEPLFTDNWPLTTDHCFGPPPG